MNHYPFEERFGVQAVALVKTWARSPVSPNPMAQLEPGTLAWNIALALHDAYVAGLIDGNPRTRAIP